MKAQELRDMTNEDLQQTLADTSKRLFELRVQAQAERLDAPSEIRRNRRLIARIK
ncbi:MAG: 50S ribosomal protein L29, partial [Planctomycetaceae bacterium]|nr:50S ribosomal protein L29 [Planctomycetaceae bacterium]